jgi:hypothetical protein
MAQNKKSVLLYCDIIHTIEQLDDVDAGILFKHYLRYINDQNPEPPSKLIQIVFEPIKQNLKRDLKKWEAKSLKNKENANKRWNANASERIEIDANYADKDKVTVIDKDKVTDKVIDNKIYLTLVSVWLNEFRVGWTFGGVQGKALKSIITKIKKILKDIEKEPTDQMIEDTFRAMCAKLPEWYKDKDLPVINSKFNEIIEQIKNLKHDKTNTTSSYRA